MQKTRELLGTSVKGTNWEVLTDIDEVRRWSKYFEGFVIKCLMKG